MKKSTVNKEALALLKKYKAGQCTPEELTRVDQWFNSFDSSPQTLTVADLANIQEATEVILKTTSPKLKKIFNFKTSYLWYSAAACVVVGFFMTLVLTNHPVVTEKNTIFTTSNGQRKNITLSDGSEIMLNAGSSFRLLGFNAENRTVSLSGEAFFKIAKDKKHPFIIKTGKIQTHVVGTSFNIRAYADETQISVAVSSGKVQVEENNHSGKVLGRNMTANHIFNYNIGNGKCKLMVADVSASKGWLNNQLFFNKATISEIAKTLERSYGVPIKIIGNKTSTGHYTVKFQNPDLNLILDQLSVLTGLTHKSNREGVTLDLGNIK